VQFSQVRLLVDDPADAYRFYRDELGLMPGWGAEGDAYASFAAGDGAVAIFARSGQADAVELRGPGDGTLLVLEAESVDEWRDKLGERVVAGPTDRPDWGGRVLHLRDPSGNLIELFQSIPMEAE
jgi:lactoylglutathione lyase